MRRGSGLSVDVLQSKSRLQAAKETRVRLEGRLREAIAEYYAVYNHAPEIGSMSAPLPPDDLLPESLQNAVDIALAESPLIKQSEETIGEAKQQRKVAVSDYFPQVNMVAEGAMENDAEGIPGNRKELFVGVRAEWELFDGFATAAASERTAKRVAETMEIHASLSLEVAKRVEVAWENLITLRERAELASNAAAIAGELFAARQRLRTAGRESVVNVLDAEAELNGARSRATAARYDALVQVYRVLFEVGRLDIATY